MLLVRIPSFTTGVLLPTSLPDIQHKVCGHLQFSGSILANWDSSVLHYKALYGKWVKLLLHSLLLHSLHRSRSRTLLMIDFHLLHVSSIWLITCTIHTAASHPERGVFTDPGIPGVLRQLAHTLWTLWVINLTRKTLHLYCTLPWLFFCGRGWTSCASQKLGCGNTIVYILEW